MVEHSSGEASFVDASSVDTPSVDTSSGPEGWALGIEYDGQHFHGWQRQPDVVSVQAALEQALSLVANEPIQVAAAGRTDAGVHATSQVVSFVTNSIRPERAWLQGVNSNLPAYVSVVWAKLVPADFHARFSAVARRYLYLYREEAVPSAIGRGQWWSARQLDTDAMHQSAQALLGEQDFTSVRAAGCQSPTPWRCVHRVSVVRCGALVVLDIEANAFLLHMVRNIASMLAQVGAGSRDAGWPAALLAAKDRTTLGPTAPSQGLYLAQVRYEPVLGLPGLRLPPTLAALAGRNILI